MTIESQIQLDEIPDELKFFDRALTEYVEKHKLSNVRKLSETHLRNIQELAASYGIKMERDGTAVFPPRAGQ